MSVIMELEAKNRVISWMNEVFQNKNFTKLDVEFPDYDNKGGYAADMVFTTVTGVKNGEKEKFELIVKQSKNNEFILETINMRQGYINELSLYSKILPQLQKLAEDFNSALFENIPKCYGTIQKDNHYVVVLENLKTKGFRVNELPKVQDLDHAKLVLRAYAEWHALCLAAAEKNPDFFNEMRNANMLNEGSKMLGIMEKSFISEIDFTLELYKNRGKPHITERLERLKKTCMKVFVDCMDHVDEKYLVIRHGDCWNNNFLFHYNEDDTKPDKVVIIDWQLAIPASPLGDVVQYLFYSTSKEELEHLDDLLKMYHDCLSLKLKELGCNPEKTFPWEACLQSFKRYVPIGIMGVPVVSKMAQNINKDYDVGQVERDGDMSSLYGSLIDPEKYFTRVDSVFELCYQRGYF